MMCSPCMRGWSCRNIKSTGWPIVFPVYAGVILEPPGYYTQELSVPRVCGGDPKLNAINFQKMKCSPCMRGWSWNYGRTTIGQQVFPVYAGVILRQVPRIDPPFSVPRVCGGDPWYMQKVYRCLECSPCMRGWSRADITAEFYSYVFPVYAGVILASRALPTPRLCVPRVCGGDPLTYKPIVINI